MAKRVMVLHYSLIIWVGVGEWWGLEPPLDPLVVPLVSSHESV